MDSEEFRRRGKEMVDYIADYMTSIEERRVTPDVAPGYLRSRLPVEAPRFPERWEAIVGDVERHIMPGMTHWQHPRFHAYFPAGNAYPSIIGDMLSDAIGCVGFSWAASPACTELETIMMEWVGRMVGLPAAFLPFTDGALGGGVIQGSASECILVSLLAARAATIRSLKQAHPFVEEGVLLSKLMAYCSKEAHSSVEKAAMIGFVKLRILETDEKYALRGRVLAKAIQEDRAMGLIPFFVEATLGTTSCVSFDALSEIGPICSEEQVWLHVDAAYAGAAFICPQFRFLMRGIEHASSFNFNPNKWMLVNFDCSLMWVKDRHKLTEALVVNPLYLKHSYADKAIDYRHWGIALSRRFRSLKLWFVIRAYGVEGLQKYILEHCRLAKRFEALVRGDALFELMHQVLLGLVCFRLKGSNALNERLLSSINAAGELHMVPASLNERYVIRFCVCSQTQTDADIDAAWSIIRRYAIVLLQRGSGEPRFDGVAPRRGSSMRRRRFQRAMTLHGAPLSAHDTSNINNNSNNANESAEEENTQENQAQVETAQDDVDEGKATLEVPDGGTPTGGSSNTEDEDDEEAVDEVLVLDRRSDMSQQQRRSVFVRMVSDPKLYNPKIVRTLSAMHVSSKTCDHVDHARNACARQRRTSTATSDTIAELPLDEAATTSSPTRAPLPTTAIDRQSTETSAEVHTPPPSTKCAPSAASRRHSTPNAIEHMRKSMSERMKSFQVNEADGDDAQEDDSDEERIF